MSDINTDPNSQDYKRFTAHLISVIWNSAWCYFLFVRTYTIYSRYARRQRKEADFSNYTIMVENISRRLQEEDIRKVFDQHFPGEVLAVHRVAAAYHMHKAYLDRLDLYDMKDAAEWEMEHDKNHKRPEMRATTCCPSMHCLCFRRPKVDTIEYIDRKLEESNARLTKREQKLKNTDSAFITFKSRDAASKATTTAFTRKGVHWIPHAAPDFNDIRWQSFEYTHRERLVRRILVLILVFFIGIMFFIPITFAQGLANLSTLAKIPGFGWIRKVSEENPTATSIIEGILPSLVITIALALVKVFLKKIVLIERYHTRSAEFRSFTSKFFYILILNVFLASIAAGTFITLWNSVRDLVEEPLSIVRLLAQRLPTQVNFFINYMAVNSVITTLFPLMQFVRLTKRLCCLYVCKPTTRSNRIWLKTANWAHRFEEYPYHLLYFAITIAYSSMAPLIVPFALIFFVLAFFVGSYNTLYVFKKRLESFGREWPVMFNRLIVAMVIYQALMTGLFALYSFVAGVVICAILMVFSVLYAVAVNYYFARVLGTRTVEIEEAYRQPDVIDFEILQSHYRDPLRDWSILTEAEFKETVNFNSRDKLRQLKLSLDHPVYAQKLQDGRQGYENFDDVAIDAAAQEFAKLEESREELEDEDEISSASSVAEMEVIERKARADEDSDE
jgi:hypothetical protein